MSTHKDCGEQIRWARRLEDPTRWLPPLEYAGEGFVLSTSDDSEDHFASEVHVYKLHRCDPDKVLAWQEYTERMADIQGTAPPGPSYALARERDRENAWEQALKKPCPRCGVAKKVKCKSLGTVAKKKEKESGEITETRWPHPERWSA
jgi:hypothetical protein